MLQWVGEAHAIEFQSYRDPDRCGLPGIRRRHCFTCPSCGFIEHADISAAHNIRNRFTILRDGGSRQ